MLRDRLLSGMLTIIAISITLHAQEFKIGNKDVQVHGFGTQGFVHTNDNNWLTMNTNGNGTALYPAGFYANVNPKGFADNTNALVVRTGFSF
jgi:hypothetical protein